MDHEITMTMDVKMDLKEKKSEYYQFRSWTKCIVTIEAIKYIPCLIKITLNQDGRRETSNVIIKINIPGVAVQLATSRSKNFSYGLFWTHQRKSCCIFFALDTKLNLEHHIKWVENSITNLERHRRQMLETRRVSRISKIDESFLSAVSPINDTQEIKDINDILGPLPKIPDSNVNWSRRVSGASEIYEEIVDGDTSHRLFSSRMMSRTSIASGIYEVMISPLDTIVHPEEMPPPPPPPLPPPRPRANTQSEISRAYTNPESITKKRKKSIFESVFLRHKTMQKQKSSKTKDLKTKPESPAIELIRNHRMSYSSPDLSNVEVNHYENEFESDLMARSSATEFSFHNEHTFLNSTTSSTNEKHQFDVDGNISANILSSFNISCNESTVNLVGRNLNADTPLPKIATIIDDESGYCRMAPILRNSPISVKELPFVYSPIVTDTKPPINNLTKTITFRRDYGLAESIENFENLTMSKDSSIDSIKDISKKNTKPSSPINNSPGVDVATATVELYKQNVHNESFDEKYPSYLPNDFQKLTPKNCRNANGIDHVSCRKENVYIATPCRRTHRKTITNPTGNGQANHLNTDSLSPSSSVLMHSSTYQTPNQLIPPSISASSSILYQKYATVTDSSSCKNGSEICSSKKRFASLPRFKKIDFSPLKLKINSVLQRQNPDQM